jgi:Ser/Thr protein kinase RdoA (MazF antagonist)
VKSPSTEVYLPIAQEFAWQTPVRAVEVYGSGNVNDTYLVTLTETAPHIGQDRFVLQRVNQHVFHHPDLILVNMRTFLTHIAARTAVATAPNGHPHLTQGWRMPQVIATRSGSNGYLDQGSAYWRAITLVEGAKTYGKIRDAAHAREAGYALGHFHNLLSDLDPALLHDTLPGFHVTPGYLAAYDQVLTGATAAERQQGEQRATIDAIRQFIDERRALATVLEDALARGELTLRAIHGDPKVDNILIDDHSAAAVSIIDLDTVKPGLVHYDIGDCLRSCCNPAGEETTDLEAVVFDIDLCRVILEGYLAEAASFFTDADYGYIYDSIRLITFELGLRFFSDYLAGDPYFKTRYPTHNLQRALVQFRLVAAIEAQEAAIRQIVAAQQANNR